MPGKESEDGSPKSEVNWCKHPLVTVWPLTIDPKKKSVVIAMISPKAKKKQSLLYSTHILI
jgi:hypothetical protein